MTEYVTDTHPLIWYAAAAKRKLSRRAAGAFAACEAGAAVIHVPVAVVIETEFLNKARRIEVQGTLRRWWLALEAAHFAFAPILADDVFTANELPWEHRDIYDRLIVAAARRLGVSVITCDEEIARSGLVRVTW